MEIPYSQVEDVMASLQKTNLSESETQEIAGEKHPQQIHMPGPDSAGTDPQFACYLDTCNTLNTVNTVSQEAKGFTRAKIAYRKVITKVLIDSGNLFGSLISEDFCNRLSLPIVGAQLTVGTASKTGHVTILGKVKPLQIYLENIQKLITIEPYVVRDLANPINLGSHFLQQNSAELTFKPTGIVFKIREGWKYSN